MNQLLRGVTTSQGIAVQLRWNLRDDVAADARRAVELLGQAERRAAAGRAARAARRAAPADRGVARGRAGGLLLRAPRPCPGLPALVRLPDPLHPAGDPGTWHDLHRRSPLSQGEQKVVCYLPLFAAAAAHFGSLAGAAPHSPRFVLLDDAFPKIDVRTHPLLFGLLVQLDLDFVDHQRAAVGRPCHRAVARDLRGVARPERARHRPVPPPLGRPAAAGRRRVSIGPTSWLADPALDPDLAGAARAPGRPGVARRGPGRAQRAVAGGAPRRVRARRAAGDEGDARPDLADARCDPGRAVRTSEGCSAVLEHVTGHALDDRAARRAQRAAGREAPFALARELVGDAPWVGGVAGRCAPLRCPRPDRRPGRGGPPRGGDPGPVADRRSPAPSSPSLWAEEHMRWTTAAPSRRSCCARSPRSSGSRRR